MARRGRRASMAPKRKARVHDPKRKAVEIAAEVAQA